MKSGKFLEFQDSGLFNPSDPDFPTTIGTIIESINVYFYSVRSVGKNP